MMGLGPQLALYLKPGLHLSGGKLVTISVSFSICLVKADVYVNTHKLDYFSILPTREYTSPICFLYSRANS